MSEDRESFVRERMAAAVRQAFGVAAPRVEASNDYSFDEVRITVLLSGKDIAAARHGENKHRCACGAPLVGSYLAGKCSACLQRQP